MLLFIEVVIKELNHLCLNCILTSSWINVFRSTIFLMTEEQEMRWLIFVSWVHMSLHAHLVSYVLSLIQLCNVTLFCSMFRWTFRELMYISISSVSMLTLLNAFTTWCKVWFYKVSSLHFLSDCSFSLSR